MFHCCSVAGRSLKEEESERTIYILHRNREKKNIERPDLRFYLPQINSDLGLVGERKKSILSEQSSNINFSLQCLGNSSESLHFE